MAIAATPVSGAGYKVANKTLKVFDLVFSGNYATGGEAYTPLTFNLRKIDVIRCSPGVARASDSATAIPVGIDYTNAKFTFYEGSAAGTALSEKTNGEAYPTGCTMRVEVVGY